MTEAIMLSDTTARFLWKLLGLYMVLTGLALIIAAAAGS
jgi:hypothetical protein